MMDNNTYWLSAPCSDVTVATVGASNQQSPQIAKSKETELSAMLSQPMVNFANIFGTATSTNNPMLVGSAGIPPLSQLSIPVTTQFQKRTTVLPLATGLHGMSGFNQISLPNQVIQVSSNASQQLNGIVNTTVIPSLSFPTTHHQVAKNFIQQAAAASGLVGQASANNQPENNMIPCISEHNNQNNMDPASSMVNLRSTATLHVATNIHSPYHCVQCNKIFENDGQLSYHTFVNHAQLQSRPHKCLSCPESFLQEHHLSDHMRAVHLSEDHGGGPPYNCSECQATFSSGGHLNYHIYMVHTLHGPKPQQHICSACCKSFIKANLLQAHIRNVHNGEAFAHNTETATSHTATQIEQQQQQDMNTISMETNTDIVKSHKCHSCDKTFKTASYLKQHVMSVHDKPLKCTDCGKGFGRKSDLKRHFRGVHVRDRPHECKKCGWTFAEAGNLKHHIKSVHTKDKEFRCSFCAKTFALSSYLRTHMQRMHNVISSPDANNNNTIIVNTNPSTDMATAVSIQIPQNIQATTMSNINQMNFVQLAIPQAQVCRCYECGQIFQSTQLLQNHVMTSHAQPFWCTVCGEAFSLASELQVHLQLKHTGGSTNNTSMRQQQQQQQMSVNNTILVPVNNNTPQMHPTMQSVGELVCSATTNTSSIEAGTHGRCNLCNLSIGKSVKNHICPALKYQHAAVACAAAYPMAGERPHLCGECGKGFKTATHLKQHVRCVHSLERPHKCSHCSKSFSRLSDLKRHVKGVHQKLKSRALTGPLKCLCGECGATFPETLQLKRHIFTAHLRGKPGYKCADCQEAFSDESSFQTHICHEEDRPNVCNVCSKRFTMPTQLRRHIRSAHSKTNEVAAEVHKCFHCHHNFGRQVDLERHVQAVHLKEKPHKCSICGKNFGLQGNLNKHVRAVHLLEKPHQCIECGKRFAHIGVLKRHLKDIHFYDKKANAKKKKALLEAQDNNIVLQAIDIPENHSQNEEEQQIQSSMTTLQIPQSVMHIESAQMQTLMSSNNQTTTLNENQLQNTMAQSVVNPVMQQ